MSSGDDGPNGGPAFTIPLNDQQLKLLGKLTATWAQIDHSVTELIAILLDMPAFAVTTLLETATSGVLINRLRSLSAMIEDDEERKQIKEFCTRMGGLIEKRNHITHGMWGWHIETPQQRVRPMCHYPKAREKPIHVNELADILSRVIAESHKAKNIVMNFRPEPRSKQPIKVPLDRRETDRFFFTDWKDADNEPPDWLPKSPLQPGRDHLFGGRNSR
jgi:hypothetical protein